MIQKSSQELKKRYFGGNEIKKVYYQGRLIWPVSTEFDVNPTQIDAPASGGDYYVEVGGRTPWQVENVNNE